MKSRSIQNSIDIIVYYTKAKLESENVRNYIGYIWWILDPLISVATYYVVFKVLLNRGEENYIEFLFVGLVCWKWFSLSISKSARSILAQKKIYKRINIPKYIFPIVEILYQGWKFLAIFIFILILYPILGYDISIYHLSLPLIILAQFMLIMGIASIASSIVPFVPDLNFLIGHMIRLLMYPSGVLFAISSVPEEYRFLVEYNLIAGIIESYRRVIMHASAPLWGNLMLSALTGLVLSTIGYYIINKNDKKYAKLL